MGRFKISYDHGGVGCYIVFTGESDGEAMEKFEIWAAQFDDIPEILSVVEVD